MDAWNWFFGITGLIGTIFSFYSYYENKRVKTREEENIKVLKERLSNLNKTIRGVLYSTDAIVQRSKQLDSTPSQLADMARVVRGQLYVITDNTEVEVTRLQNWKFGEMIQSKPLGTADDKDSSKKPK